MDFNNMDFVKWNKAKLVGLMNTEEFFEMANWSRNNADSDQDDNWLEPLCEEEVVFHISKRALKHEMCLPEIDWNRVKTYVTACPPPLRG